MFLKKNKKPRKTIYKYLYIPLVLFLITIILTTFLEIYSLGKISLGIKIVNINVSNKTKDQAFQILSENIPPVENFYLVNKNDRYEINPLDLNLSYDLDKSVQKAYNSTRSGNFFYDLSKKIEFFCKKKKFGLEISINETALKQKIEKLGEEIEIKPVNPSISLADSSINVQKGTKGVIVDYIKLRANIGKNLTFLEKNDIEIPLKEEGDILNEIEIKTAFDRASKIINKNIKLRFKELSFTLDDQILVSFMNPKQEYFEDKIQTKISEISSQIEREPQNSVFIFEESKIKEFKPSLDGYKVEADLLKNMIIGNLRTLEQSTENSILLNIPVKTTAPEIQTKDVNNLGIETLLGSGSSKFLGSIANRIYNISHASEKFKGIIVAPGENFSFNKTLGDVSQETGFKQAYIIKEGKTILGDGGGVCQVSTTLFRAALSAGLPILERQAHAYRVGYYEQDSLPGLDATVFDPHPDLVIKNDTPNYILIQSIYNEKNRSLVFEIYGTDDGRISTVSKPIVSNTTPPPEDLYQDDPTLPIKTIKQIEYKAWGAKVKFDYEVKRNNETIYKKTFYSNYQPWQAVYLQGTMPQ